MNGKRLLARLTAAAIVLAFIAGFSVGVYHDAGGWPAVAAMWGTLAVLLAAAYAFAWALDNWNAR
ncbi:hypothetical protein [Streptomyces goshikiensis]|uniref:hypothetical protein n=1 Tax=Streptomyces goshikiensis TaxID=1942 RepID=UPI0037234363